MPPKRGEQARRLNTPCCIALLRLNKGGNYELPQREGDSPIFAETKIGTVPPYFLPFRQSGQSRGLTLPIILTALTKQTLRVGYANCKHYLN